MLKKLVSHSLLFGFFVAAFSGCEFAPIRETTSSALLSATTTTSSTTTTTLTPVNLLVPIEMLQMGVESQITGGPPAVEMLQSQTSLNPADYNGSSVQYFFEVVAENQGLLSANVGLIQDGTPTALFIAVPGSTGSPTHFRSAAWTPAAGNHVYTIGVAKTSTGGQLKVYNARILVKQVGATQTRIYVPLLSGDALATSNDPNGSVTYRSAPGFSQQVPEVYSRWLRDNSKWGTISGWKFEAVASHVAGNPTVVSLFTAGGSQVLSSAVSTSAAANTLMYADIPEADLPDSTEYEVRVDSQLFGTGFVAKAGLWITLTGIAKGEVYYALGRHVVGPGLATSEDARVKVNVADYSNPQAFQEAVLYNVSGGPENIVVNTWEMPSASGTANTATAALDTWTAPNGIHSLHRSLPFTLVGDKYYISKTTYGILHLVQHRLGISFSP